MTGNKLTKDQILAIPEKLKTMSPEDIAKEYGKHPETIKRWARKLRAMGHEVTLKKGPKPILET
jgi:transposase